VQLCERDGFWDEEAPPHERPHLAQLDPQLRAQRSE
jgi:hypothetical protein